MDIKYLKIKVILSKDDINVVKRKWESLDEFEDIFWVIKSNDLRVGIDLYFKIIFFFFRLYYNRFCVVFDFMCIIIIKCFD